MAIWIAFGKVLILFTLTGLSLFRLAPRSIKEIHSWVDRVLLSLLTGIAFYTIFFLLAQGLLGLPITEYTVWGTFLAIILLGSGFELFRRKKHLATSFEQEEEEPSPKKPRWREPVILFLVGLLFFFALNIRLQNGLKYPDKLLDADPYRHHIRTEAVVDTGKLSKFDPYLMGEVPIFELQGCYILAGVLGVTGPFSPWSIWLWGAQIFGALSVISIYLFTKLSLKRILEDDLGPPPKPKRKKKQPLQQPFYLSADLIGSFLGLIAGGLLAASPVHILRTNAGFSEAFAIPLLAPTLLFYLWAAQSRIWGDFVWFGIFFSALAFINPVPAVFIVPFFIVHAVYVLVHTKDMKWLWGNMLAGGIFFLCLAVWNWKFLATPLLTGAKATSQAGTAGILKSMGETASFFEKLQAGWGKFTKDVFKNLGYINLKGPISQNLFGFFGIISVKFQRFYDVLVILVAYLGCISVLWNPRKKSWRFDETSGFFFLSFLVYFLILFLIPFGFISFTSKYYRYILPISLSLSFMTAYFFWRLIFNFIQKDKSRITALTMVTIVAFIIGAEGKTWGGWVLNCSPEEYAAAEWINKNAPVDAYIIANWYTGDYIRSLTKRRVIISDYPRIEVRVAKEKFDLDIPILPRNPKKVVKYVQEHPGDYYLLKSKWGPWGKYDKNPHFQLLDTFGKKKKTMAKIYQVDPDTIFSKPPPPSKKKESTKD